jgi:hypothetical protein
MKTFVIASFLSVGLASQVLAAPGSNQYFAVIDTVGNCAVVDTLPSKASGLKILANKDGFNSESAAQKALGSQCKSVIDRG